MHRKILAGEILAWRISYSQCIYHKYIFGVPVNIGEENFGEWLTICQIHQFFLNQNFPCVVCHFIPQAWGSFHTALKIINLKFKIPPGAFLSNLPNVLLGSNPTYNVTK